MRKRFLDSLKGSIQDTLNNTTSWPGYGPPSGGAGGGGYPSAPPFGTPNSPPQAPPPCPRQVPQAGHADWIGLPDPRYAAFNVCPACYAALIRPTPYAGAFVTKGGAMAVPAQAAVRCDMSRFWVRVAGAVLLTMNFGQGQLGGAAHLAHVAAVCVSEGEGCPNAGVGDARQLLPVVRRGVWFTLQDPATGAQPLAGWLICGSCAASIQACCPAVAAGLALVQPPGWRDVACGLVPSERYDDARTASILQQVGGCAVTAAMTRRVDMGQLVNWLVANPPPIRGDGVTPGVPGVPGVPGAVPGAAPGGTPAVGCPRNLLSTTTKCHTMQGLFDLTACEHCYASVVKPDADRGVEMARRFEGNPSAMPSGFTCQLYSDRMRRVWSDAVSTGNFEYLRQKVLERRAKERELQAKTAQLRQQASQLREQAGVKEHLAINAMRLATNTASNNIMLSGVGVTYQVDANHYVRPNGVPDFSQTTQLNNEAAMLKVRAAQAEAQVATADEEWKRYWE